LFNIFHDKIPFSDFLKYSISSKKKPAKTGRKIKSGGGNFASFFFTDSEIKNLLGLMGK
jgi:hypothetical protein